MHGAPRSNAMHQALDVGVRFSQCCVPSFMLGSILKKNTDAKTLAGVFDSFSRLGLLAKKAIEEGQMKWKNLANSMHAIVWIAGPDGSVRFFNDRWYELHPWFRRYDKSLSQERLAGPGSIKPCQR
jgi:hypothetical protein